MANQDEMHLRMLSIFHYILAAMMGLGGCVGLLQLWIFSQVFDKVASDFDGGGPPDSFAWIFLTFVGLMLVFCWAMAVSAFLSGMYLKQHRNHTFCLVIAAIECLFMPLGTILGVFSILVLMRPSVQDLFTHSGEKRV